MWTAVIQMQRTAEVAANCERAHRLIDTAAARGARLIALPEYFLGLGPPAAIVAQAQALDCPLVQAFQQQARQLQIHLLPWAPSRSWPRTPARSTTPPCFWVPAARSWAGTDNSTCLTSTSPARSVSGSQIISSRAMISSPSPCPRTPGPWGWLSAMISGSRSYSGPWWTGAPKSSWCPPPLSRSPARITGRPCFGPGPSKIRLYILAPAQCPHPDQSLKTYGRSLHHRPLGAVPGPGR